MTGFNQVNNKKNRFFFVLFCLLVQNKLLCSLFLIRLICIYRVRLRANKCCQQCNNDSFKLPIAVVWKVKHVSFFLSESAGSGLLVEICVKWFQRHIAVLCTVLRVRSYFKLQTTRTIYKYAAIKTYGTLNGEQGKYRRENQYHKKCPTTA